MRTIIGLVVAVLISLGTTTAQAIPVGNPFCKLEHPTPAALKAVVKDSLAQDPTGRTMLDPIRCHMAKPARPVDYLEMFKLDDPRAGLSNVSQLPAYFDKLDIGPASADAYWVACLKQSVLSASGWKAAHNCLVAHFKIVWFDRETGRAVLKPDCTNPIGAPEKPRGCVYLDFDSHEGDEVNIGQSGPTDLSLETRCVVGIERAGEKGYQSPRVQECPDLGRECTWGRQPLWWTGSFVLHKGRNRIRLPYAVLNASSDYRMWFCIERASDHSKACGLGVRWLDYLPDTHGTPVAHIYYDQDRSRDERRTITGIPSVLWWDFNLHDCPD